MNHKKLRYN